MRLSLAFTLLIGLLSTPARADENAALLYYQAFISQGNETITGDLSKLLAGEIAVRDHDALAAGVANSPALPLLRRGAAMQSCDWGLDYEAGPGMLMPHLGQSRKLARLARVAFEWQMIHGAHAEALDNAMAALVLARHTASSGNPDSIIGVLVQFGIEEMLQKALATHLPRFTRDELRGLQGRLAALPPSNSIHDAVLAEKRVMLAWLEAQLKTDEGVKRVAEYTRGIDKLEADPLAAKTREQLISLLPDLRAGYDRIAKTIQLSPAEFLQQFQQVENQIKASANPLMRLLLPALVSVRRPEIQALVRRAMLDAAIARQLGDEAAFTAIKDPLGGAPFEVVPFDGGYELRSRFADSRGPVTLVVGERK